MNCESLINNFFPEILGSIIGSGATIFALYKTIKFDKKKELVNEKKKQIENLQHFSNLLDDVIHSVNLQINFMSNFCAKINNNDFEIPMLENLPNRNLERLVNLLSFDYYYHAFIDNIPEKRQSQTEFMNICSLIDYFFTQNIQIISSVSKSIKSDNKRKVKYKQIVENTMNSIVSSYHSAKLNNQIDDFYNFINQTILEFYKNRNQNYSLTYYQTNFVEVLKTGLIENFSYNSNSENVLISLQNATYLYSEIKLQNRYLTDEINVILEQYQISIEDLKINSKRLIDKYKCN